MTAESASIAISVPAVGSRSSLSRWRLPRAASPLVPGNLSRVAGPAGSRVHWCGRDYEYFGQQETWAQVTAQERLPVRPVGGYPPFGPQHELFAAHLRQAAVLGQPADGMRCAGLPPHRPGQVPGLQP